MQGYTGVTQDNRAHMGRLPGSSGYIKLQRVAKIIVGYTRLLYVGHTHQSTCHVVMPSYNRLHWVTQGYRVTCSMPHRNFTRQRVKSCLDLTE